MQGGTTHREPIGKEYSTMIHFGAIAIIIFRGRLSDYKKKKNRPKNIGIGCSKLVVRAKLKRAIDQLHAWQTLGAN